MAIVAEMIVSNAAVGTVLAVAIFLVSRIWNRPAVIHSLWCCLLLKMLIPPVIMIPLVRRIAAPMPPVAVSAGQERPLAWTPINAEPVGEMVIRRPIVGREKPATDVMLDSGLLLISAGVSSFYLLLLAVRGRRFHAAVRFAQYPPQHVLDAADRLCSMLGLRGRPLIRYLPGRVCPMVWGIGKRTTILLPLELFKRLSPSARQAILAHELR